MGTLGNAFKRELGKNTGKFVSNVIFGDGHSTPYRRVDKAREANANARQQMAEARMKMAEAEAREARERSKRERKNQLYAVDSAVLENIDLLNSQAIPTDKQELLQFLSVLAVQLKAPHGWMKQEMMKQKSETSIPTHYWKNSVFLSMN